MIRRPDLHDRTASGILDAAAQVFSERGEAASMAEVAAAVGVGRATLYRYWLFRGVFRRSGPGGESGSMACSTSRVSGTVGPWR